MAEEKDSSHAGAEGSAASCRAPPQASNWPSRFLERYQAPLLLTLPILAALVLSKVAKFPLIWFVLQNRTWHTTGWLLSNIGSFTTLRVAGAAFVGYLLWRRFFPRYRWAFALVAALGYLVLKIGIGLTQGNLDLRSFTTLRGLVEELHFTLATFGPDFGFAALWFLVVATLLGRTTGSAREIATHAILFATLLVLFFIGMDLAYFGRTGEQATAQTIEFLVINLGPVLPIIRAELSVLTVALLLAGPAILVATWKALATRAILATSGTPATMHTLVLVTLGLIFSGPAAPKSNSDKYAHLSRSPLTGLTQDYLFDHSRLATRIAREELSKSGVPAWHTSNLRLVPTERRKDLNVVIVMLESIRASSTTPYSSSLNTTPFLARLAQNALTIDNMYAVIPRTESAWISILYGLYPLEDMALRPWVDAQATRPGPRSLPEVLRTQGYSSAFFVPTHLNLDKEQEIISNMRFDRVFSAEQIAPHSIGWRNYMGYEDNAMLPPIRDWMKSQTNASRPFLLAVMTNVAHHDYKAPPAWETRNFAPLQESRGLHNAYLNVIAYTDAFVEKLFAVVTDLGLAESTIFVVLGDHGDAMNEYGWVNVRDLRDDAVKVPAVIYAPQFRDRPRRVFGPRQQIDVLPTIAELLGYEIADASLPGFSLMQAAPEDRRIYLSGSIERSFLGVRAGSRKTVYHFRRAPVEEFDLEHDPKERNPASVSSGSAESERIEQELLLWRERSRIALKDAPRRGQQ